jgi:FkbM family methyltransferase
MWSPKRLYSQNFEDLYLSRLFAGIEKGFYVDAGAWHPVHDSVTAIFYEQGWRGINVEPVKEIFDILDKSRPGDENLCLAVVDNPDIKSVSMVVAGENPCEWGHHHIHDPGLGSGGKAFDLHATAHVRTAPASTLREIIEKYSYSQKINFLKIDVEGFELEALLGLDLPKINSIHRPEVILFEATIPNTRLSASHRSACQDYLSQNSYRYLYSDGLNDYFCEAGLHASFEPLMLPPNIFDSPQIIARQIFDARESIAIPDSESNNVKAHAGELQIQLESLREQLVVAANEAEVLRQELMSVTEEKEGLNLLLQSQEEMVRLAQQDRDDQMASVMSLEEKQDRFMADQERVLDRLHKMRSLAVFSNSSEPTQVI